MSEQDQIKAIAELDGWKVKYNGAPYNLYRNDGSKLDAVKRCPNDFQYLTSRDAIVPIREKLVNTQALKDEWMELAVMVILETEKEVDEYALTHLTAAQECQTLLLLFKKWN